MNDYLRHDLKALQPYKANDVKYSIKMDANESPWDIPNIVKSQLANELLEKSNLNLYPDSDATALRYAIAKYCNLKQEEILVGAGSDELIQILINAFVNKGDIVLCPTPSFGMYKIFTQIAGGVPIEIPLGSQYCYDMDLYYKAIESYSPKVIFLCVPNNPTGNIIPVDDIVKLARAFSGIVVIDEAYIEFCGKSAVHKIIDLPNVVVLRTFSKAMGLAGLRIGYSICNRQLAMQIHKIKPPYNVNSFSQRAAILILENIEVIHNRVKYIIDQRGKLFEQLSTIKSVYAYPSSANFILIKVPNGNKVFMQLLDRGILVRNFSNHPSLKDCLRITVGMENDNNCFVTTLKEVIS